MRKSAFESKLKREDTTAELFADWLQQFGSTNHLVRVVSGSSPEATNAKCDFAHNSARFDGRVV